MMFIRVILVVAVALALSGRGVAADTTSADSTYSENYRIFPWSYALYVGFGFGVASGFRTEFGATFGANVSLGLNFTIYDSWSSDPGEGMIGASIRFHVPTRSWPITPYLLLCAGKQIHLSIGGESYADGYQEVAIGGMWPVMRRLIVRPEVGAVFGHVDTPWRTTSTTYLNVGLQLEIILGQPLY